MTALRVNHVSVHAADLDASEAFYAGLFGLARLPAPDFGFPVRWFQVGDTQLHLFNRAVDAPPRHHFAFTVDDLAEVYRKAQAMGALNRPEVRRLPDGCAQTRSPRPSAAAAEQRSRSNARPASVPAAGSSNAPTPG